MIEIHHSRGTRGFRAIWACEELEVPYRIVPVDFSADIRARPEWRRMNPVGKVPAMRDGELVMFESGAMVQHVLDRYGAGRLRPPPATPEHALYLQWSWFAESTFARPLGEIVNHRRAFAEPIEACVEEMRDRARLCAQAVDEALAERAYLVGDTFTAADIMMGYTLRMYARLVPDALPGHAGGYFAKLCERPAYLATCEADASA